MFKPPNQPGGKLAKAPHRSPHNHYPTNFKLHRGEKHTHTHYHTPTPAITHEKLGCAYIYTSIASQRPRRIVMQSVSKCGRGLLNLNDTAVLQKTTKGNRPRLRVVKSLCTRANPYLPSAAKILQPGRLGDDGAAAEAQRRGARANKVTEL